MDAAAGRPIHIQNGVQCADFIGRDQVNIRYGYSAEDIERLIEKVLAFLTGGAVFLPAEGIAAGGALQAEAGGERLVFPAEALQRLASFRNPRAYLLALLVKREYQVWATKFVPLAARMDVRQAAVLDIPVAFSEFRLPPPGSGPEAQPTSVHLEDITQALAAHSAFIILGEPGSGKTTTLQKIAFESARAGLAGLAARLPLYVRLSQQAGRDPYTFLQTEWERRTGRSFAEALAAGQALILADGINELPRGPERAAQLKAWRLFGEDYAAANPIVFTSRTRDYDQQLDLPRVLIEPLDEARIDDYLERNQAQGLRRLLDDPRTRLRPMASNPFNLCLLAYAYKSDQRAMANRGHLLDWFVGALFQREKDLAHPGWIECAIQSRALAELAYKMQRQGESTIFPYAVARAAVIVGGGALVGQR